MQHVRKAIDPDKMCMCHWWTQHQPLHFQDIAVGDFGLYPPVFVGTSYRARWCLVGLRPHSALRKSEAPPTPKAALSVNMACLKINRKAEQSLLLPGNVVATSTLVRLVSVLLVSEFGIIAAISASVWPA